MWHIGRSCKRCSMLRILQELCTLSTEYTCTPVQEKSMEAPCNSLLKRMTNKGLKYFVEHNYTVKQHGIHVI